MSVLISISLTILFSENCQAGPLSENGTGKLKVVANLLWSKSSGFSSLSEIQLTSNGKEFIAVGESAALWRTANGQRLTKIPLGNSRIKCVDISHNGKLVAFGCWDGSIRIWQKEKRKIVKVLRGHKGSVNKIVFLRGDEKIVTCGHDGTIRRWEVSNQNVEIILKNRDPIVCMTFSLLEKMVVYGDSDAKIFVYDIVKKQSIAQLSGHERVIRDIKFSHDKKKLVSVSNDRRIIVWDTVSWKKIHSNNSKSGWIYALSIAKNKCVVLGCLKSISLTSNDSYIEIWDRSISKNLRSFHIRNFNFISSLELSKDAKTLVACSHAGEIAVWALSFQEEK